MHAGHEADDASYRQLRSHEVIHQEIQESWRFIAPKGDYNYQDQCAPLDQTELLNPELPPLYTLCDFSVFRVQVVEHLVYLSHIVFTRVLRFTEEQVLKQ